MIVLSSCQSFPGVGSATAGAPGLGLNVPGRFHLGYSRSSRALSFLFTSNISNISARAVRTIYPAGLLGSGETYQRIIRKRHQEEYEANSRHQGITGQRTRATLLSSLGTPLLTQRTLSPVQ